MKSPFQRGQPLVGQAGDGRADAFVSGWLVLMGLDAVRFHWSTMPSWLQFSGGAGLLVSSWLIDLVFRENHYLIPVVRIQEDRGHQVVATGPYAVVRHPLYAAAFVLLTSIALLLGSWWGLVGAMALTALMVLRTALEDRTLMRELAGYPDYAARVRFPVAAFRVVTSWRGGHRFERYKSRHDLTGKILRQSPFRIGADGEDQFLQTVVFQFANALDQFIGVPIRQVSRISCSSISSASPRCKPV